MISNLSAPGGTIPAVAAVPQKGPYELLHLLLQEEADTSHPNAAMAQRYVLSHFSPCSLIYELHSKDNWERDPYFHHYSLLCNTQINRPVFPVKSQKPYHENCIKNTELLHIKENPFPSYLYWRLQNSHLSLCRHFSCYRRACSPLSDMCILCSMTRKHSQNFSSL